MEAVMRALLGKRRDTGLWEIIFSPTSILNETSISHLNRVYGEFSRMIEADRGPYEEIKMLETV